MTCPNCGHANDAGAAFCAECGTALRSPAGPAAPAAVSGAPGARLTGPPHWPAVAPDRASRLWAMGAHLSALAGGFMGGVPAFLGPLVVWLIRKDDDPFAAAHGRAALNFNLSVLLYAVALVVLTIFTLGLGAIVAIPLGMVLGLAWLILSIVGTVRAGNDEVYRYPLTIPFVR